MGLFGSKYNGRARFYDSLAAAMDAGLPSDKALAIATDGYAPLSAATVAMGNGMAAGQALSETMATRPDLFGAFEVHAVEAGERAGRLPDVLGRLGRYFAARGSALDQLGNRLIYPVFLLHGAVLLPPLFLLVRDGVGAYVSTVVPILLTLYGGVAGLWWGSRSLGSSEAGRRKVERFVLALPLLGDMARSLALADYAHLLFVLYASGVPLVEALDKAASGSRAVLLRVAGRHVAEAVRSGRTLAASLAREERVFGRLFVQAVHVGEEAGKLDDALEKSARAAQQEAEQALQRLSVALPALAYAVAAVIVGFVVLRFWASLVGGFP